MYKKNFRVLFFISLFAILFIFFKYPGALILGGWQSPALLLSLALTFGIYWWVAARDRSTRTKRAVVIAGYLMGFSWLCEIVVGNLNLHPSRLILDLFYRGPILLVVLTNIGIGFFITQKEKRLSAGLMAAVQSGMMSGLMAISTLVGLLIFTLSTQLTDKQNIHEFLRSGGSDFPAFLVQGYSFAGLNHLWIGLLGGLLFGSIGGFMAVLVKMTNKQVFR